MGSIGDCYDNAMIESFWGRMQTELLNRKRWKTRIELANAIFDYLEIFHNRQRRHSALGMRTPIEFRTATPIRPTRGLKPSMATPPNPGYIIPFAPGASGELVYTALVRDAMPLIRFRSRDFVEITAASCDCGRTGFKMRVVGRVDDMFVVRGVNVYPSAVQSILAEFRPKLTGRCRIVLPASGNMVVPPVPIEAEVPAGAGVDPEQARRLEAELRDRLIFRSQVTLVPAGEFGAADYKTRATVRRDSC
jgi:acyl-CoA synthetase (AMP-forming)/AMP-acid ligase II